MFCEMIFCLMCHCLLFHTEAGCWFLFRVVSLWTGVPQWFTSCFASYKNLTEFKWLPLRWMILLRLFCHLRHEDFHCSLVFHLMAIHFFNIVLVKYVYWEAFSEESISISLPYKTTPNMGHNCIRFLYWRFSLCLDYHSDTFFIRDCTKIS